jgi:hypothetical protein
MGWEYIRDMSSTSINVGEFGIPTKPSEGSILTARPDLRIIKVCALGPVFLLVAGLFFYFLPLSIDPDFHLTSSILLMTFGVGGLSGLLVGYEALGNAVYTLTTEHVEEQSGIVYKRLRRIPLSYVRDVTHTQNFLQAQFGVSSIAVSTTNGDKIVFSNVKDGIRTRDLVWKFALARSPVS